MKKVILFLLLIPILLFSFSFSVKADTLSTGIYGINVIEPSGTGYWYTNCNNLSPDIGIGYCPINRNIYIEVGNYASAFLYITNGANLSNKTIAFNFYVSNSSQLDVSGLSIIDNTRSYACEIYSTTQNSGTNLYSVICPNLPTLTGQSTGVSFLLKNTSDTPYDGSGIGAGISSINGWSTYDTAMQDIISKLDTSNSNLNTIKSRLNEIKNNINSTNSKLDDIKNKLDQQKQDNDEWKNTDISESDKQAPDTSDYSSYQTAENNLFDKMDYADTSSLNITTDSNSLSWIWSTIISFYNSNVLLMNFVISILSIGIIKLALGR